MYLTQNDTYLSVCEEEDGVRVLHSCNVVQRLEILVEGRVVVATTQLDLEALVAANVGRQPEIT